MQITEVVSTVYSVLAAVKVGIPVWTAIGVFLAYCYVRSRSGSSNFLRERLWRILGGAGEFTDAGMDARWKRVRDFERYRYSSGIKFKSSEQIVLFESWLKARQVALEELLPHARYYDVEKTDLRDPNLRARKKWTIFYLLLCLCWACFFGMFLASDAQMRVKVTHTYFWVSTTEARAAFTGSWKLTPDSCTGESDDLDSKDKEVICKILTTKEGKEFIENSKQFQSELSAVMIAVSAALFVIMFLSLMRTWDAHHLYNRSRGGENQDFLEDPAEEVGQKGMVKAGTETTSA
jgi:hypothetical protein